MLPYSCNNNLNKAKNENNIEDNNAPNSKRKKSNKATKEIEDAIIKQAQLAFSQKKIQLASAVLSCIPRERSLIYAIKIQDSDFLGFVLSIGCSSNCIFEALATALSYGYVNLVPFLLAELAKITSFHALR